MSSNKSFVISIVLSLFVIVGCTTSQVITNDDDINDLQNLTIEQKIQNLDLYKPLAEEDINKLTDCDKSLLGPVEDIKILNLYKGDRFNLNVLSVPGLQDINILGFNNFYRENMCDGLGQQNYLLALDDHLLTWDPIGCGFEIGELWGNETEDSKACAVIRDELYEIHENAIEEWRESQNFDDLSFCGGFIRDDSPQGLNKYLFCRNKWDGECYYKNITYAETMGCYFDENDSRDTPFVCMESWTKVYDSEGNIKNEKALNRNLPQDDHCEPTNREIFEQKVN